MNQSFSGAQSYEVLDTELAAVDREPQPMARRRRRGKRIGACCAQCAQRAGARQQEGELAALAVPGIINVLFKLRRAGRLGWRAGRWIDKQTGRRFGKSISQKLAEFIYERVGRSKRAEDFFDSLPEGLKRWLYRL